MLNAFELKDIKPLLVNLTGVRVLTIFSLLLESPKSAEEINKYFEKNNYPKDMFSIDTLRNDLNALRIAGCNISRADKSYGYKYKLISHPFELKINYEIAKSISKLYNKSYQILTLEQLISLDKLFKILAQYATDKKTFEYLHGISYIKNIDYELLKDLINAANKKLTVNFCYKAPNTGKQNYEFKVNNLEFRSKKLYINGYNKTYECSSFLLVSKIISPITVNLQKEHIESKTYSAICELYNTEMKIFEENDNEKLIEKQDNKIIIEIITDNPFKLIQKILSYGSNCTVISPENVRNDIINTLKSMREIYQNG